MNNFGFVRAAAAVPAVALADPASNAGRVLELAEKAASQGAEVVFFPYDCLCGITCGDLRGLPTLENARLAALSAIQSASSSINIKIVLPSTDGSVFVVENGECVCDVGQCFGGLLFFPFGGSSTLFQPERTLEEILSSNASGVFIQNGFGESVNDGVYGGYACIFSNGKILAKTDEFSTESQLIVADVPDDARTPGLIVNESPSCSEDFPFVPGDSRLLGRVLDIQAAALRSRMEKIGCRKVVIGVSGGLDSCIALMASVHCFDKAGWPRENIIGISMPGFGTSDRTRSNASIIMEELGISQRTISIVECCRRHLSDIGHDGVKQDIAYENSQARERTQILMDVANMENAIVIGTGDLSESALGWCTYNGDHMSNYALNASVPKTLIRAVLSDLADTKYAGTKIGSALKDIVDTPVSPELKGSGAVIEQVTEDNVGPYELVDFFIWHFIHKGECPKDIPALAVKAFKGKYSKEEAVKWLRVFIKRFFSSQFKRSCSPDGPQVSDVSFSPRNAWKMPSDVSSKIWLAELDSI